LERTDPRAKFHVYRGNVSPLWGEKPIFGPVSKNNTGMAALRADLPVNITFAKHNMDFAQARAIDGSGSSYAERTSIITVGYV